MKQSEEDFVNAGLSGEELEALNAPSSEPAAEEQPSTQEVPQTPAPQAQDHGAEKVDVRALQEARANERQLRAELAKRTEEQARLDERVNMLAAALQSRSATPEPAPPTLEEDPFGHIDHRFQGTAKELETLKTEIRQFKEAEARRVQEIAIQNERAAVLSRAQTAANRAAEKHPDVNDAVNHVVNASVAELQRRVQSGIIPPERYEEAVQNHFTALCAQAPEDPDQFADYIRSHARFWNWQGKQGGQPQPSVQDLAARQERHMSLSGVSGGEAPQAIDAKALANMSDKEFTALMRKVSDKDFAAMATR